MLDPSTIPGVFALAGRSAGALARIGADRILEVAGRALPRTPEQLARPEVIDALLREGAPAGGEPLPPVRAARLPGVTFESSNCTNFLVEVEWAEADRPLPKTLYAKLPCPELATRAFANAVGFWAFEAAFCRDIAAKVPVRVPQVLAVCERGARFVLLLENLHETRGTRLFLNRDMAAGTTVARSQRCLRSFARLHASFWGWRAPQREALLPSRLHPYLAPGRRAANRALNAVAIDRTHEAAPDVFEARHARMCHLAIEKWDALIDAWYREPLTLIHGDSHLANCFEFATPEGSDVGLLDFQGVQWCPGMRDVQYHCINSLDENVLAAHEEALIETYIEALAEHGVALAAEDARAQYRAFSFQTLMVSVVSLGLGSLTEREDTVRTLLRRSVAAIDRLDFAGWLATL